MRRNRYERKKKKMCKVSVVVPSKNVAGFMKKCLESVRNQTLSDLEIICVDACSTDGTREIIKEFQQQDCRIVLLDDTMGSSGYADNLGFSQAKGEYLAIVESDDYITPDMMETLYEMAKANDLDYIKANYAMFIEDGEEEIAIENIHSLSTLDIYGKVIHPAEYPELLELDGYMWKGLYRKGYIVEHNIRLNETKGAAYQDNGFLHQTLALAKRAMYVNQSFYHYRRDNENSSDYNPKGFKMMLEEYRFIEQFIASHQSVMEPFMQWYYLKLYHQFRGQLAKIVRHKTYSEETGKEMEGYVELLRGGIRNGKISQEIFGEEIEDIALLLNSPRTFYDWLRNKVLTGDKMYHDFIREIRAQKELVLVCCGDKGTNLHMLLRRNGVATISAVCDNQKDKQGTAFYGIPIVSVEDAAKGYPDACFVIANDKYHNDLKRQLLALQVPADRIRIFNAEINPHFATNRLM